MRIVAKSHNQAANLCRTFTTSSGSTVPVALNGRKQIAPLGRYRAEARRRINNSLVFGVVRRAASGNAKDGENHECCLHGSPVSKVCTHAPIGQKRETFSRDANTLGFVATPDRFFFQSHATQAEANHLFRKFLMRHSVVDNGLTGQ